MKWLNAISLLAAVFIQNINSNIWAFANKQIYTANVKEKQNNGQPLWSMHITIKVIYDIGCTVAFIKQLTEILVCQRIGSVKAYTSTLNIFLLTHVKWF